MKHTKNPFVILAFGFIILFFVPLPEEYLPIKIVIALMVISYGISLGAFRKKDKQQKITSESPEYRARLEEVEKILAEMENKETVQNGH